MYLCLYSSSWGAHVIIYRCFYSTHLWFNGNNSDSLKKTWYITESCLPFPYPSWPIQLGFTVLMLAYNLTGHVNNFIQFLLVTDNEKYKSCSPFLFESHDSFPLDTVSVSLTGTPFSLFVFIYSTFSLSRPLLCLLVLPLSLYLPPSSFTPHGLSHLPLQLAWSLGIAQMLCYSGLSRPRIAPHVLCF